MELSSGIRFRGDEFKMSIRNISLAYSHILQLFMQVSGGGLPGTYNFGQFHFHWGNVHNIGSEHLVSEESYLMEVWRENQNY